MNEHKVIGSFDGVLHDGKLLLTGLGYGALFEYDFKKEKVALKCKLPENLEIVDLYIHESKLYIFPFFAQYILTYDIGSEKFERVTIKDAKDNECSEKTRINRPIIVGDKVYLFPIHITRDLMVFDLKTASLSVVDGWWSVLEQHMSLSNEDEVMVIYAFDKFWVAKDGASVIYEFDQSLSFKVKHKFEAFSINGLSADEEGLWIILHNTGNLVYWDRKTTQCVWYKEERLNNRDSQYIQVVNINGYGYVLPNQNEQIARIDKVNRRIHPLGILGINRVKGNSRPLFNKFIISENKLYLIPLAADHLLSIDLLNNNIEKFKMIVDEQLTNKLIAAEIQSDILKEKQHSLEGFVKYVSGT